jgi:hypothetical protein
MTQATEYDKDLRQTRRWLRGMVAINLAAAVPHFLLRNYPIGFTCILWAISCAIGLRAMAEAQKTRDIARIATAAFHSLRSKEKI